MLGAQRARAIHDLRDILTRPAWQRRLRHALRDVGPNPRKLHRLRLRSKASRYLDEELGSLMTASPVREFDNPRHLKGRFE